MRQLWVHRCVEILQGQIQQHVHSPSIASGTAIRNNWIKIQQDMKEVFIEMEKDIIDNAREKHALQDKKSTR